MFGIGDLPIDLDLPVQDLGLPFGRNVIGHGCAGMRHHHHDLSSQMLGVECEGFFASAVEGEIGVQRHFGPSQIRPSRRGILKTLPDL